MVLGMGSLATLDDFLYHLPVPAHAVSHEGYQRALINPVAHTVPSLGSCRNVLTLDLRLQVCSLRLVGCLDSGRIRLGRKRLPAIALDQREGRRRQGRETLSS